MYSIETRVKTANASRYLLQLSKHWAHRMPVTFTPIEARIPFSETSVCLIDADIEGLDLRIEAPDPGEASRLGDVVLDHLRRFAFREGLEEPVWRLAPTG
jgi:hypothetical protein